MQRFPDPDIVDWVSSNVLPFEAELRERLARVCKNRSEVDDVVQEVYCRILKLDGVDQIRDPRGYLMRMAKNILIDQFRHDAVVEIEAVANLDELEVEDPEPGPERVALARAELKWVLGLISNLPDRCKQVFRARRIYGLSQSATAATLGLTENVVEKETMRGMAILSDAVARVGVQPGAGKAAAAAPAPARRTRHG
ncbi:MAG: sigma-70 family RNA polymerase sigma factor [Asticcacaulis sp.]|nr:sigma-70 family RNA polymerase sigma factor [Asticcacaulis sp.]